MERVTGGRAGGGCRNDENPNQKSLLFSGQRPGEMEKGPMTRHGKVLSQNKENCLRVFLPSLDTIRRSQQQATEENLCSKPHKKRPKNESDWAINTYIQSIFHL